MSEVTELQGKRATGYLENEEIIGAFYFSCDIVKDKENTTTTIWMKFSNLVH